MDEPTTPGPTDAGSAGTNGLGENAGAPDGGRLRHSVYMTGVLARALTAQLEELAGTDDEAAPGWWFARSEPRDQHR